MSTPDPRLDEIQARLSAATPGPWEIIGGNEYLTGIDVAIGSWDEGGIRLRDAEFIAMAPGDVHYLLAELRKAHEALERVETLHQPVKIYDECDCPDGTHPDEYDYIDCEDYVGCENSLSGVGCQECCVDSWDSLTQECGENHSHSKDPAFRCDTIKALRAAVAAAKGDDE